MPRVNVWLSEQVYETLRRELPDASPSKLLRQAIEDTLHCFHEQLACARCGCRLDASWMISRDVSRFYLDCQWALERLMVNPAATIEGAGRLLKDVAALYHARGLLHRNALTTAVPRRARSVREALTERDRQRPPTARQQAADAAHHDRIRGELAARWF